MKIVMLLTSVGLLCCGSTSINVPLPKEPKKQEGEVEIKFGGNLEVECLNRDGTLYEKKRLLAVTYTIRQMSLFEECIVRFVRETN